MAGRQGFDWDGWFNKPGLPPKPAFDTTLAGQSEALAEAWRKVRVCPGEGGRGGSRVG